MAYRHCQQLKESPAMRAFAVVLISLALAVALGGAVGGVTEQVIGRLALSVNGSVYK
jgi:hypothetical protein